MTIFASWRRAASAALSLCFAAVLLSGCVLGSTTPLVPESEAVAAMPPTFKFVTYSGTGPYTKSKDETGGEFVKAADTAVWADPTGAMKVYFTPRADGSHLVSVISSSETETGVMYGLARIKGDILELRMIFGGDPAKELEAAGVAVPAGVTIEEGAVTVTDRAGLDAIIELMANGTVTAEPIVAYVGTGTPPETIVKDGDWYKAG